ncbi:MAG: hypothetical protein VCD34_09480 [Planctomycetota bacterium]
MAPFEHAIETLEYARMREIISAYAESTLGRGLAGELLPCTDGDELRRMHAETRELTELLESTRLPLAGLSDVCSGIEDDDSGGRPLEPEHLYRVVDLLRSGLGVREAFTADAQRYPALFSLAEGVEDLPGLREEIPKIIDLHDGVRSEASEKLSGLRLEITTLQEKLRFGATALLKRPDLRKCFQSEGVTLKNDRYLLPVKAEYRSWMKGPVRDRSQSGSTLYIEPEEIVQGGDSLLSLLDSERDEVLRILWDLTRKVRDERVVLRRLQKALAWVDFTAAKASYAAAFGLISPGISDEGVLDLRQARHPYLMWLSRDMGRDFREIDLDSIHARVVPLDLHLGDPAGILIVTGPNTGGKTVALKTVGLNVLLALSGVPVSAASAAIPVYTDLFVDIGDEQSIEQNLSTFSGHLRQLVEILRGATGKSLILLDELGSGTDPLEGAALGTAILDYFRTNDWKAIITTHLGSMKKYAFLHEGVENAAMEFDTESLKPTYRLLMGIPGNSNALAIARRLGVSEEVIVAAEEEISRVEEPTRELISRMEKSSRGVEKERRRAESVRLEVQQDKAEYSRKLAEIDIRRDFLEQEADLEIDRVMRQAREALKPIVDKLKNVPQTHKPMVDELATEVELLLIGTPLGRKREEFARSLRKGDEVRVPKLRGRGKVRKINKSERVLTVVLDGIPTEVGFDDISWIEDSEG